MIATAASFDRGYLEVEIQCTPKTHSSSDGLRLPPIVRGRVRVRGGHEGAGNARNGVGEKMRLRRHGIEGIAPFSPL